MKTANVKFSAIKYPCGCVWDMNEMKFCPLHGSAPDLLADLKEGHDIVGLLSANWETGDIANMVRRLDAWREKIGLSIRKAGGKP